MPVDQFNQKAMGMYDEALQGGLGFLIELLQCHKVCEIGGDELHRPPWWP